MTGGYGANSLALHDAAPPSMAAADAAPGCPAPDRGGCAEDAFALAAWLRRCGRYGEAEAAYRRGLLRSPRQPQALVALAALALQREAADEAQALLLQCCGIDPDYVEAWDLLALTLLRTGDARMAEAAAGEASRLAPATLSYALRRLEASLAAGTIEAEMARLDLAVANDPADVVALVAAAVARERLGYLDEAVDMLEAATLLAQQDAAVARLYAGAAARAQRPGEAIGALRRAAVLEPGDGQIQNDLGAILMRLHRHAEAREALRRAIALDGPSVPVLCNLANVTICLGEHREAIAIARQAVALGPADTLARRTLANTLPYCDVSGREVSDALIACGRSLRRPLPPIVARNAPDPGRRLRVGLLSNSLRTHPVGWLTIAGVEALDPAGFDVIGFGHFAAADAIARRFHAVLSAWHPAASMDDRALAAAIREREIDILIDLGGYGDGGRLAACAHRPAPVQVKWVGMQTHTSGLDEIDWIITDRWETPSALEPLYSERPLRLADGYVCYSPPAYAPDVAPLPARTRGRFMFGCFNNLAKMTRRTLAVWCEILRRSGDAGLILKTHQYGDEATADRVRAAFATAGVDPARIELRGASPHREFLRQYGDIDIALDPFPYSGGLSTCEALWMGVPALALPGETFSSRHSMSHLCNGGLSEWVAESEGDYIERAVACTRDPARLAALRAGLRDRVAASPLCDARRFGDSLGVALRHAWTAWCATQR